MQRAKGLKEPKSKSFVILRAKTSHQDSGRCLGQTRSRGEQELQLKSKSSAQVKKRVVKVPDQFQQQTRVYQVMANM